MYGFFTKLEPPSPGLSANERPVLTEFSQLPLCEHFHHESVTEGPGDAVRVASGHCYDKHMCEIINPVATLFSYPVLCFPIPFTRA